MTTITRIKRIEPIQFGKVLAIIYGLLSLIFVPFYLLFLATTVLFGPAQNGGAVPVILGVGLGFIMMFIIPAVYAGMGFILGVIGAFIYNVVAKWVGGIEVELE